MIILLFYIVEVHVVELILFYILIYFECIQINDHHNPYYFSIVTSCLAPNNNNIIISHMIILTESKP